MTASKEDLRQTVETFWETFPTFWHSIRAHIRQVSAERFNISVEQFHILRHIHHGCSSVSELAEAKNISRPAISQSVDTLVNKGLVSRATDSHDRRHVQLTLTEAGNALLDTIFQDTRQWMMERLAPLTDMELQSLTQGMNSLRKTQTV